MSDNEHDPAEAEATGADTVTVNYDGRDWTFPASLDGLRYSQVRALETKQLGSLLPSVLPKAEHKILLDEDPSLGWINGLCDAWAEAAGFADLGG